MEGSVRCKVRLNGSVIVTCARQRVAYIIYDAVNAKEVLLIFIKILLYRGAEEGKVCYRLARAGVADAG